MIALIIGSITFRLRGPYFVLASIAVAEIIRLAALNWKDLTNGAEGILSTDLPLLQFGGKVITDWNSKAPYYYMGLALAVFSIGVNFAVTAEQARLLLAGHPRGPGRGALARDPAHPLQERTR